ncbi:blast:Cathepsin L [Drosophila guanche]|uniref:Blast:Cathepsin L n=1 Tax=Drosophila guanche TaxID=7266 RepID=A0A3B0J898_DROGU|nr:blast:Cathepsin L [Drosophila guanche]
MAVWSEWEDFQVHHNKSYHSAEEHRLRFLIFVENKRRIAEHNERWAMGQESQSGLGDVYFMPPDVELGALPRTVDWRARHAVTDVKDQGNFNTCWSFAATGVIEGRYAIKYGHLQSLSEQNLVDCCLGSEQGYSTWRSMGCTEQLGGIDTESSYPYQGDVDVCRYRPRATSGKWRRLCFEVLWRKVNVNHGLLVVGYGTDPNTGDYWLLKNSWGSQKGYIRMARNKNNQCGVASEVLYPIV